MRPKKDGDMEVENEEESLEESLEENREVIEQSELDEAASEVDEVEEEEEEEEEIDDWHLYELCVLACEAGSDNEDIWDEIRAWYKETSPEDRAIAIDQRQHLTMRTALHEVCNHHNPPVDIIETLLECSLNGDVAKVVDQSAWIPLHIACNSETPAEVIQLLVDAYPEGAYQQDQKGRTPLHFLVIKDTQFTRNGDRDKFFSSFLKKEESFATKNMIKVAEILTTNPSFTPSPRNLNAVQAQNSAERVHDLINNMLPIHYACAYGIPTSVIKVLVTAYPESINVTDKFGRTPLHYSMRNADNSESPQRVQLLVDQDPNSTVSLQPRRYLARVVDMADNDGSLPIQQLSAKAVELEEQNEIGRENVIKCLNIYLNTKPLATAKFLTGLQTLPKWLKDTAVVNANVKTILNKKIAKRIPTMFLLLDGLFLIAIIIVFAITGRDFLEDYKEGLEKYDAEQCALMQGRSGRDAFSFFLYIGTSYFLIRGKKYIFYLYIFIE